MSAQFPTVPNLPGVPPVARASAVLQGMLANTGTAQTSATAALAAVNAGDTAGATSLLNVTSSTAGAALAQAVGIFSNGSNIVQSLSSTVSNAGVALEALGVGGVMASIASIEQTIAASGSAFEAINALVNPVPLDFLGLSGFGVRAALTSIWGLYTQGGEPAVEADNVIAFENSMEARISDYPVAPNTTGAPDETVGFGSYNKVILPYDIRLIMSRGGSVEDRIAFFEAVTAAWESTELFNVITPEFVYTDVNVVGVRRSAANDRGANLMVLEVALRKVRQTATLSFTQTKEPSGSGQVQDGSVQASASSDAQQYAGVAR